MKWTMDKEKCKLVIPSRVLSMVSFTLAATLLVGLASFLHIRYLRSVNQASEQLEAEEFVWSNEIRDWAVEAGESHDGSMSGTHGQQCIWPEDLTTNKCKQQEQSDRIINQIKLKLEKRDKLFKISIANDLSHPEGGEVFLKQKCLVNRCHITRDLDEAQAIIFQNADVLSEPKRAQRWSQVWIAHLLESPPNTFDRRFARKFRGNHEFNWTASYRSDSDIVTPYSKWVPYAGAIESRELELASWRDRESIERFYSQANEAHKKLIEGKKTKVAWFVSNCHARNNRLEYARELAKYIQVDIYGACGNLTCPKGKQSECLKQLNQEYKYYLAFENSNNSEYITEKLYLNAYGYNDPDHLLVPIVMGPSGHDYERLVPPHSFIHVDEFESAESLAEYLKHLGQDQAAYYWYFRWKTLGRFIDTKFLCRVCAMLHQADEELKMKSYSNIKDWWLGDHPQGRSFDG